MMKREQKTNRLGKMSNFFGGMNFSRLYNIIHMKQAFSFLLCCAAFLLFAEEYKFSEIGFSVNPREETTGGVEEVAQLGKLGKIEWQQGAKWNSFAINRPKVPPFPALEKQTFTVRCFVPGKTRIVCVYLRFVDAKGEIFQLRAPCNFMNQEDAIQEVEFVLDPSKPINGWGGDKKIDWPLKLDGGGVAFLPETEGKIYFEQIRFERTVPLAANLDRVTITGGVGSVFTSKQPVRLQRNGDIKPLEYKIKDWEGVVVKSGEWPSGRTVEIAGLSCGYYNLYLESPGKEFKEVRSFVIVPELSERRRDENRFYAIDSGQNYYTNIDESKITGDAQELITNLIQLAGVTNVRDRFRWAEINPKPNVFNWNILASKTTDLQNSRGIKVTGVFTSSPSWTRTISPKLPDDLMALYRFTEALAKNYKGKVSFWEFWNEPDINFAPEPAWRYGACLKAAYLGFKAGDESSEILNGALCTLPDNPYWECLFRNELLKYSDIFNIHAYAAINTYWEGASTLLRKFGCPNGQRIFITENSTNLEGLALEKHSDKIWVHSPEQEMLVAEVYPKAMLKFQAYGVERVYRFVMIPYNERDGHKDWGMMRRDGTVKPVYAALSTMNYLLNDAKYLGEYQLSSTLTGHLLARKDGTQILAFWSRSPVDSTFKFDADLEQMQAKKLFPFELKMTLPDGDYSLFDIFGKETKIKGGENKFSCTRYPRYLVGKLDLKPTKPGFSAGSAGTLKTDDDLSVVVDAYVDNNDFGITDRKATAVLNRKTGKLQLSVYNFSNTKKTGKLEAKGGKLDGVPAEFSLDPFSKQVFQVTVTPDDGAKAIDELVISGSFNNRKITQTVIPLQLPARIFKNTSQKELKANVASAWRKNSSGEMTITDDAEEKAVHFNCKYQSSVRKWCFPEYILQPKESFKNAVALSFEIKSKQDKIENDFNRTLVYICGTVLHEVGKSSEAEYPAPIETWEMRVIPLHRLSFPLEDVKMIRIGGAPQGNVLDFWIRNVRVIYKEK